MARNELQICLFVKLRALACRPTWLRCRAYGSLAGSSGRVEALVSATFGGAAPETLGIFSPLRDRNTQWLIPNWHPFLTKVVKMKVALHQFVLTVRLQWQGDVEAEFETCNWNRSISDTLSRQGHRAEHKQITFWEWKLSELYSIMSECWFAGWLRLTFVSLTFVSAHLHAVFCWQLCQGMFCQLDQIMHTVRETKREVTF